MMKTPTNEHTTINSMASGAHEAVDKIADTTTDAVDSLQNKGQQLKDIEEHWVARISEYIQENPLTSLGIALAGGYLVSRILGSR